MTCRRVFGPVQTLLPVLLVGLLQGCQDLPPLDLQPPEASYEISEARTGGNPDLFFAAPLAANPGTGDENFDEGASNDALVPTVRVCRTSLQTLACDEDVTAEVTGSPQGLAMTYNADNELYQVNWKTDALAESDTFRVEIWGLTLDSEADRSGVDGRWLFGWRDVANSPSTAACDGSEAYCLINYGQTIPVKVRIEDFVFCPVSRNCAVQFIASGTDANLEATLSGEVASSVQIFIPGQEGTDFALAFEPCSPEEEAAVDGAVALPTFGPCLKTVTPPKELTLAEPATVSLCVEIDEAALESELAVPESQLGQLTLHHFGTGADPTNSEIVEVEAWPHVPARCESATSGGLAGADLPDGLLGRALVLGERLLSWVGPRPLLALDIGGGGTGFELNSFFKLALPAKFEYVAAEDADQLALAGSEITLRAKVTDVNGDPVWNAKVGWELISAPGGDAGVVTSPPVNTGQNGIAEASVRLSSDEGDNVFHATGLGIADDREQGCALPGGTGGAASCNGPRSEYDPFLPLSVGADPVTPDAVVALAEGTRLPFTIYGCIRGRGTASVNGTLSEGEWACADSEPFPVNLSGGSTVEATFYWMNDDDRFYLAVEVPETERTNALRIDWDNDGDGGREVGDDVWEFDPGAGAADRFIDERCSTSSQSACGEADADFGGGMQTEAAFDNTQGGVTVYEVAHPLATGDLCTDADPKKGCGSALDRLIDINLGPGDGAGLFVTLRLGNGAQGNTQWPGFLDYLSVTIR